MAKKCHSVCIWLKSKNPTPNITSPARIILRGPNVSISQPCSGPRIPLSTRVTENANENSVFDQPNSSRSTAA